MTTIHRIHRTRRPRRAAAAAASALAALALVATTAGTAHADPDPSHPGQPPAGTPSQIWAGVGADAFAELTNNAASVYNAQTPTPTHTLASYDAVNPSTGAAGESVTTKPGCSVARPNGANAGVKAILLNQKSTVDPDSYCIDFVRSSRSKGQTGEGGLTFYAQSRDAVSYATVGNAYAPTTPLTTAQLKDIFECTVNDWSEVGGQAGPIHVYLPPSSAATLTFFLQAIGSSTGAVHDGCGDNVSAQQQNDGRTMLGDPMGIAPYAVTKWAAQANSAPGIADNRGGAVIGLVNTTATPTTTTTLHGTSYEVLNPAFTTGDSSAFGRLFFNVVRTDASDELKSVFKPGGFFCTHADDLLIPFGNTPLGDNPEADHYCGQAS